MKLGESWDSMFSEKNCEYLLFALIAVLLATVMTICARYTDRLVTMEQDKPELQEAGK